MASAGFFVAVVSDYRVPSSEYSPFAFLRALVSALQIRPLFRHLYPETKALIYVVDSTDRASMVKGTV